MAGIRVRKLQFLSQGFADVLTSSGVDGIVASEARAAAQEQEGKTGVPYEVRKDRTWDGRIAYVAKPVDEEKPQGTNKRKKKKKQTGKSKTGKKSKKSGLRVANLTHEEWMRDVWPRVGGAKWRPHS